MESIIPFLARNIPTYLAAKALGKSNPKLNKFFIGSGIAGYTVDQAIDFLRDNLESSGEKAYKQKLKRYEGKLRPEEEAAQEQLGEGKNLQRFQNAARTIGEGGLIAGLYSGGNNPSPQIQPSPMEEASTNLGQAEQMQEQPEGMTQQATPQPREQPTQLINFPSWNRIKMTFPQLTSAIQQHASQGLDPASITQQLRSSRMLNSIVNQLESKHKIPMEQIVEFWSNQLGQGQQGMPQEPQPQQKAQTQNSSNLPPELKYMMRNIKRNRPGN